MRDLRSRLYRAQRLTARYRRPLAAVLAAASVLAFVHVLAPPPPPTTAVLVASHDLVGGSALSSSDLRVVSLAESVVPSTALVSSGSAVGRTLAGPISAGELITRTRLVSPGLAAGFGADRVSVPVRVADAGAVDLLRVGDRVDLYAATDRGDEAPTVVRDAPVIAIPAADSTLTNADGALIVLAVSSTDAARLAQAMGRYALTLSMR